MKHIKPVYISILTVVVFVGALLIGMQTDWWQTEGRQTPLGSSKGGGEESTTIEEGIEEKEHTGVSISGSSTIGDALGLGLTYEQLEDVLEGPISEADNGTLIKDIVTQRGLQFGVVKDELNSLID